MLEHIGLSGRKQNGYYHTARLHAPDELTQLTHPIASGLEALIYLKKQGNHKHSL